MTEDRRGLEVEEKVVVAAPVSRVWDALVTDAARATWWPHLELDATPGGRMRERWTDESGNEVLTHGQVLDVVDRRFLRLSWADEGWPAETTVEITLDPVRAGTAVSLRHSGWERLRDGSELASAHRAGWRRHLENLRCEVESARP